MADLAILDDVSDGWRELSGDELVRAPFLISRASRFVRARAPWVDSRIAAGMLDRDTVSDVVVAMVRRALNSGTSSIDASQVQSIAGPFQQNYTPVSPGDGLYLTKEERRTLGIRYQRAFTVDLGPAL